MKLTSIVTTAIALTITAQASDGSDFTITPSGLRAVAPSYNGEDGMRAFNHSAGLSLVFQVVSDTAIEKVNYNNSKIISVVDDTGRDLVSHGAKDKAEKDNRRKFWTVRPKTSEDGLACLIETSIFAPFSLPSRDAKEVVLKAKVEIETKEGVTKVPVEINYSMGLGK